MGLPRNAIVDIGTFIYALDEREYYVVSTIWTDDYLKNVGTQNFDFIAQVLDESLDATGVAKKTRLFSYADNGKKWEVKD